MLNKLLIGIILKVAIFPIYKENKKAFDGKRIDNSGILTTICKEFTIPQTRFNALDLLYLLRFNISIDTYKNKFKAKFPVTNTIKLELTVEIDDSIIYDNPIKIREIHKDNCYHHFLVIWVLFN
jgi:hypothetical protein